MPNNNTCQCAKRANLTPHVDFLVIVTMLIGFKFLNEWLMVALIIVFLIHHALVRTAESGTGGH